MDPMTGLKGTNPEVGAQEAAGIHAAGALHV